MGVGISKVHWSPQIHIGLWDSRTQRKPHSFAQPLTHSCKNRKSNFVLLPHPLTHQLPVLVSCSQKSPCKICPTTCNSESLSSSCLVMVTLVKQKARKCWHWQKGDLSKHLCRAGWTCEYAKTSLFLSLTLLLALQGKEKTESAITQNAIDVAMWSLGLKSSWVGRPNHLAVIQYVFWAAAKLHKKVKLVKTLIDCRSNCQ